MIHFTQFYKFIMTQSIESFSFNSYYYNHNINLNKEKGFLS